MLYAPWLVRSGMTTSISSNEASLLAPEKTYTPAIPDVERSPYRVEHTLASRFLFLILCVAIVLSALAYGTVHYWALTVFSLGAFSVLVLWAIDGWKLGSLRVSRNVLQLPLLAVEHEHRRAHDRQ